MKRALIVLPTLLGLGNMYCSEDFLVNYDIWYGLERRSGFHMVVKRHNFRSTVLACVGIIIINDIFWKGDPSSLAETLLQSQHIAGKLACYLFAI